MESGRELVKLNELSNYTALYVREEGWTREARCRDCLRHRFPVGS